MSRYSFDIDGKTVYDWRQMYYDLCYMLDTAEDGVGDDSDLADALVSAVDEAAKMF